jgi:hypothetical protein
MKWDYQRLGTWSEAATACATVVGLVVAVGALIVAAIAYRSATNDANTKLSADALLAWNTRQPVNSRPCFDLMKKFGDGEWMAIINRTDVVLKSLSEDVQACFSDQDNEELATLFDRKANRLTRKGSFLLSNRLNETFDADEYIAALILKGVGNQEMFLPVVGFICRDDQKILEKLPRTNEQINKSFQAVRDLISRPKPYGCS